VRYCVEQAGDEITQALCRLALARLAQEGFQLRAAQSGDAMNLLAEIDRLPQQSQLGHLGTLIEPAPIGIPLGLHRAVAPLPRP
jgi:hypothetical protein